MVRWTTSVLRPEVHDESNYIYVGLSGLHRAVVRHPQVRDGRGDYGLHRLDALLGSRLAPVLAGRTPLLHRSPRRLRCRDAQGIHLRFSLTMNVMHLTIDYAEEFFGSSPGLAEVFAALRTIKYVKIHDVGIHGVLFLRKTRSCFVCADLTMAAIFDKYPRCLSSPLSPDRRVTMRNPIVLLHDSQDDLESLTASGCRTLCPVMVDTVRYIVTFVTWTCRTTISPSRPTTRMHSPTSPSFVSRRLLTSCRRSQSARRTRSPRSGRAIVISS
ncbi:hypothetical protein C8T65DRAFT_269303 [Cerioporus squamosus]|nr:hypothetical protein C8T65DRAFT_269303 [Cerioporus squamosus]